VTTPEIDAYPQPLCTVYSLDFLPIAEQALKAGNYKMCRCSLKTKRCSLRKQRCAGLPSRQEMFENLNTPEDLDRAAQAFVQNGL